MSVVILCPHCLQPKPCLLHSHTARGNATYGNTRWRKVRRAYLRGHPLCVRCQARGIVCAATVCDHITPLTGPDDPTLYSGPFQGLCDCRKHQCHRQKTWEDRRAVSR